MLIECSLEKAEKIDALGYSRFCIHDPADIETWIGIQGFRKRTEHVNRIGLVQVFCRIRASASDRKTVVMDPALPPPGNRLPLGVFAR
jgi:hypothetical protein